MASEVCNTNFTEENGCSNAHIGSTFRKSIRFLDTTVTPPVGIDMTGYDIRMDIVDAIDFTILLSLGIVVVDTDTGFFFTDILLGEFTWTINEVDTAAFAPGIYRYDMIFEQPNGEEFVKLEGFIQFKRGVTP